MKKELKLQWERPATCWVEAKPKSDMSMVILVPDRDTSLLQEELRRQLPAGVQVALPDEVAEPTSVEVAIAWKQPHGAFEAFPHLRWVCSLGAGVDHLLQAPDVPPGVLITRVVSEQLKADMRDYVLAATLAYQKHLFSFFQQKEARQWMTPVPASRNLKVGILGAGALGMFTAEALAALGMDVRLLAHRPRAHAKLPVYAAQLGEQSAFLDSLNVLVCLLPLTPQTEHILNQALFRQLTRPACLINVGRGRHLHEPDLLNALDEGRIEWAFLDVTDEEPLPATHPFWQHPKVVLTPHIASITDQRVAARLIAENYVRWKAGEPVQQVVDVLRGY